MQPTRFPYPAISTPATPIAPASRPTGRRVAFITDITGVPQAWQVRYDPEAEDPGWPDQLTFQADRVMGLWCSPAPGDDRLIYTRDVGGNENAQIYLYSPGDGAHLSLTAGHEDAMHIFGEWSRDASRILFAANRRDPGLFDLYLQPLDGAARLVWENPEPGFLTNLCFSPGGDRAAATLMSSSFRHHLFEIDLESGAARRISPGAEDTRYDAVCYDPGGRSLFLNTDLDSDFLRIARLNLDDMTIQPVVSQAVDVELMTCSPDGRTLAYAANLDGASELRLLDLASGETRVAPGLGADARRRRRDGLAPGLLARLGLPRLLLHQRRPHLRHLCLGPGQRPRSARHQVRSRRRAARFLRRSRAGPLSHL